MRTERGPGAKTVTPAKRSACDVSKPHLQFRSCRMPRGACRRTPRSRSTEQARSRIRDENASGHTLVTEKNRVERELDHPVSAGRRDAGDLRR
jgi:hypothetical protein